MRLEDIFKKVKTGGMECWDIGYFSKADSLLGLDYVGVAVFDKDIGDYLKSIRRKDNGKKLKEVWDLLNTDLYVIDISYSESLYTTNSNSYFNKRIGTVYKLYKDEKGAKLRIKPLTGLELRVYQMMMREDCFHNSKNNRNGLDGCPVPYLDRTKVRHVL